LRFKKIAGNKEPFISERLFVLLKISITYNPKNPANRGSDFLTFAKLQNQL
jgi:hypothetical protein